MIYVETYSQFGIIICLKELIVRDILIKWLSYRVKEKRKTRYCPRNTRWRRHLWFHLFCFPIFYSISSSLIALGVDGWRAEERDLFSPHTHIYNTLIDTPVCVYVRMSICRIMTRTTALSKAKLEDSSCLVRSLARIVL